MKSMCVALIVALSLCVAPTVSRAAEVWEVWTPAPLTVLYDGPNYYSDLHAGTNERPFHIALAGTKNGAFSGQAAYYLSESDKGREAKMSDLTQKGGNGSTKLTAGGIIPASAVDVRYAWPTGKRGSRGRQPPGNYGIFDALAAKPRDSGQTHPVWITVNVPSNAVAGEYEGKLTVGGRDVPVTLTVADWTLPKPTDYQTWVDFVESPESVALRYGVELWSDRHWELLEKSFGQMAKVGNKSVYIELIRKTNFGNGEGMVRWVRETPSASGDSTNSAPVWRAEDSYRVDFTIIDKYLDLAEKHFGKPPVVCFYVWDVFLGGAYFSAKGATNTNRIPVTLYDAEKKQGVPFEGPAYSDPDAEKFWKPVADGLMERMKKRGLEKSLMVGMGSDVRPTKDNVALWKKLLPDARWVLQTHGLESMLHGVPVGYCTTVWKAGFPSTAHLMKRCGGDMEKARMYGWQNKQQVCCFARDIACYAYLTQLLHSRLLGEMNIAGCQRGFGRMSADFWACLKDGKGQFTRGISARYPESNWAQLNLGMMPYFHCGPDGAEPTIRFVMLREGVQECEARLVIDRALVDKSLRAKLGEELAKKCQDLLDERTKAIMTFGDEYGKGDESFPNSGWQDRSASLYAMAGEVTKKLASVAGETAGVNHR